MQPTVIQQADGVVQAAHEAVKAVQALINGKRDDAYRVVACAEIAEHLAGALARELRYRQPNGSE